MGHLAVPGVVAAGLAALAAAAIVLVAGLLIALVTPDASILGVVGRDGGLLTEGFRQAVSTLLAPVIDTGPLSAASGRLAPMIFVAIPIGAVAWATRWQLGRTEGARPAARIAWAAVVGLPFGLLMLAFAVLGGDSDVTNVSPSAGSAFGLGTAVGRHRRRAGRRHRAAARRSAPRAARRRRWCAGSSRPRPRRCARWAPCSSPARRSGSSAGSCRWAPTSTRSAPGARPPRRSSRSRSSSASTGSTSPPWPPARASRADATGALGLPFPVDQAGDVPGRDGGFRVFSYTDAMPAYVFLPALVLLIGLLILAALYAGFAAARAVGAATPPLGAAWGAVTGPAWAIAMSILISLAGGLFHGDADGGSVFGLFLLLGAVLGAGGGVLAVSDARAPADRPVTAAGAPDAR